METRKIKNGHRTTYFLIGSFTLLLLISIGAFICLGRYISRESEKSIHTVGDLYMAGINNHITAHFRTLIELKLEQAEAIVEVVPSDMADRDELYQELVYRSGVRNFNYLALYSEDGKMEMLDGNPIQLADPDSFRKSLLRREKKIAVGFDSLGTEVVILGISAEYPMENGEACMALVAAVPIDYISAMLGTDEENALISSNIIRKDGSFIISDTGMDYKDYFESLYQRYPASDRRKIDAYVRELSDAMEKKESYSTVLDLGNTSQQIYCTLLPYSEWHLVTVLPFGPLNETVESLNANRTFATLLVGFIILTALLVIFYIYFRMTCKQLRDLEAAREEALAATRAKSTFLSNMSHDIRTPMNAIIGFTTLALKHIDQRERVREYLGKIMSSGNHLLGLINDVLDMSRIESGKIHIEEHPCSLPEIWRELRNILHSEITAKGLALCIDAVDVRHEDIYCDKLRLDQVFLNLLSNAVKFTGTGGQITVRIVEKPCEREGFASYVFTVKDTGIGMSEDFLSRIFEPFERERTSTISGIQGTGLGMAIAKNIVDLMGGTISVKSRPGQGTEFTVGLSFRLQEEGREPVVIGELQGCHALVVDDDFNICDSVTGMLGEIGMRPEWTLSGREAVLRTRQALDRKDEYQVYLIDWLMPDMNGVEVARRIRREAGDHAPIIILSAYDWSDIEEEAREAGVTAFCGKPLFLSELRACLRSIVSPRQEEGPVLPAEPVRISAGDRILLAEDNALNREIAIELLGEAGFAVETAENGREAVEKLSASSPGYYRLVLMDVQMPLMDGYEATRTIRRLEDRELANIPILAMTANAFEEDRQAALASGMNGHIAKPIDVDKLLETLKGVLEG